MRRSFDLSIAFAVLLLATAGCGLYGASPQSSAAPSTPGSRATAGAEVFRSYCASCHGVSARGDGPVAPSLRVAPADLTRIAARRGGFDAPAIAAYIDGRTRVASHGPGDMPIWGRRFDDRLEPSLSDETKLAAGEIYLIVEYLREIQRE